MQTDKLLERQTEMPSPTRWRNHYWFAGKSEGFCHVHNRDEEVGPGRVISCRVHSSKQEAEAAQRQAEVDPHAIDDFHLWLGAHPEGA